MNKYTITKKLWTIKTRLVVGSIPTYLQFSQCYYNWYSTLIFFHKQSAFRSILLCHSVCICFHTSEKVGKEFHFKHFKRTNQTVRFFRIYDACYYEYKSSEKKRNFSGSKRLKGNNREIENSKTNVIFGDDLHYDSFQLIERSFYLKILSYFFIRIDNRILRIALKVLISKMEKNSWTLNRTWNFD